MRWVPRVRSVEGADEVRFAKLNAVVTENGVGGGQVEIEVRQREAQQIRQSFEGKSSLPGLDLDRALLLTVDLRGRQSLKQREGLVDAGVQIGKIGLIVGKTRRLLAGQPRTGALCEIAGDLHLAHHREHVGVEARLQEDRGLN